MVAVAYMHCISSQAVKNNCGSSHLPQQHPFQECGRRFNIYGASYGGGFLYEV